MNLSRQYRLYGVLAILIGVSIAVALVLFALRENINLFYTPTQVVQGKAPQSHAFRVGGLVKKGSVKRQKKLGVVFTVTDTANDIKIYYKGILPDLFREGQGIVAQGYLNKQGAFVADQVLAKHDENYMPPEVKSALADANKINKGK